MTYRDRLRNGSFRGVAFTTPESELEGGRRGVVHEYPGRDTHSTQDLGKRAQRFTVTAVIIGDDYDQQRDQLIEALEKGGPGKLVHRYHGEMQAEVEPGKTYRLVETQEEGRVATFTIPFIRAGEAKQPSINADSAERVKGAANVAKAASLTSFASTVKTSGPEFVRADVLGTLQRANSAVASINSKVSGALSLSTSIPALITSLGNNLAELVASPTRITELGDGIYAIQEAIFGAVANVGAAFKRLASTFGGSSRSDTGVSVSSAAAAGASGSSTTTTSGSSTTSTSGVSGSVSGGAVKSVRSTGRAERVAAAARARTEARKVITVTRQAEAETSTTIGADEPEIPTTTDLSVQRQVNQKAVVDLVKQAATIEAARASVDMPYDSHAAAIAMRDQLEASLVALAESTEDDEVYAALVDLRVEVIEHLTQAAGALPRIVEHTPLTTIPVLLLAHRIYGDAARHEDIVARNNLRHPGFVAGGVPLQVLSDG